MIKEIKLGKVVGADGYSPNVTVKKQSENEYVLTVTNKDGAFDMPNLKPKDGREVEFSNSGEYIQWRYVGEGTWRNLISIADITGSDGTNGTNGREVELRNRDGIIEWKYINEATWTVLLSLPEISNAQSITLRNNGVAIQVSYDDGVTWTDLISISELTGSDGADGQRGSDGADGKSIELRIESGYLQWRQTGGVWGNLIELASLALQGEKGSDGKNGTDGKSAYEIWLERGNTGSEQDFIIGLQGRDGVSPYIGGNGNWYVWNGTEMVDSGVKASGGGGTVGEGKDGREVEFRNNGEYIQWRYVGDVTWRSLISIADITGSDGEKGSDGHTPIKGTDYYTEVDKNEMVTAVLEAMPIDSSLFARMEGA